MNLGKWVLRYLFDDLVQEEVKRDDQFRHNLLRNLRNAPSITRRVAAPSSIELPPTQLPADVQESPSMTTPLASGKSHPKSILGLAIGAATPLSKIVRTGASPARSKNGQSVTTSGQASEQSKTPAGQQRKSGEDYFTAKVQEDGDDTSSNASQQAEKLDKDVPGASFSQRLRNTFSPKKSSRATTMSEVTKPAAAVDGNADESDAKSKSSDLDETSHNDRMLAVIEDMHSTYLQSQDPGGDLVKSLINTYSLDDAPVLRPAPGTKVLIQEEATGAATSKDLFEARIGELAQSADSIERCAPSWLGEILLRVLVRPRRSCIFY